MEKAGRGDFNPVAETGLSYPEYLKNLMDDARILYDIQHTNPDLRLHHVSAVLKKEIDRVWKDFHPSSTLSWRRQNRDTHTDTFAPFSTGHQKVRLERKLPIPTDKYPTYNFIGRILGPRGMSVKQLEQETGCEILVRGQGSVRDRRRESRLFGKKGWEHLSEPLHILITVEDTRKEADRKIEQAASRVQTLLTPNDNDENKRRQLMELAIINGTYRPQSTSYPKRVENFDEKPFRPSHSGSSQRKSFRHV